MDAFGVEDSQQLQEVSGCHHLAAALSEAVLHETSLQLDSELLLTDGLLLDVLSRPVDLLSLHASVIILQDWHLSLLLLPFPLSSLLLSLLLELETHVVLVEHLDNGLLLEDSTEGLVLPIEAGPQESVPFHEVDVGHGMQRFHPHNGRLHFRRGSEVLLGDLHEVVAFGEQLHVRRQPAV